jgi:hypothetical protein
MDEPRVPPDQAVEAFRQDAKAEYYAILDVITGFDQRVMIVKGWSVTLSLAALGLGFQQGHYALFALAGATGLAFWLVDTLLKWHQMGYYSRMRDIEVTSFHLNHLTVGGVEVSSPRIDWYWGFRGAPGSDDWRDAEPRRRTAEEIRRTLGSAPWQPHVLLPHAVAVLIGLLLFVAAAANISGLDQLEL